MDLAKVSIFTKVCGPIRERPLGSESRSRWVYQDQDHLNSTASDSACADVIEFFRLQIGDSNLHYWTCEQRCYPLIAEGLENWYPELIDPLGRKKLARTLDNLPPTLQLPDLPDFEENFFDYLTMAECRDEMARNPRQFRSRQPMDAGIHCESFRTTWVKIHSTIANHDDLDAGTATSLGFNTVDLVCNAIRECSEITDCRCDDCEAARAERIDVRTRQMAREAARRNGLLK